MQVALYTLQVMQEFVHTVVGTGKGEIGVKTTAKKVAYRGAYA
jgi:hypothetical protein